MTAPIERKVFTVPFTVRTLETDDEGNLKVGDDNIVHLVELPDKRNILFYEPADGQIGQIARGAAAANRGGKDPRRVVNGIAQVLNVLGKMVVRADDYNFLEDGLTDGTVSLDDFTSVLDYISEEPTGKPTKAAKSGRR